MRGIVFLFLFFSFTVTSFSNSKSSDSVKTIKKEYIAIRISHPPKIDGDLNDSCWKNVPVATDFIQNAPYPGIISKQRTEVKFLYDDGFIYVGATMFDSSPDSILCELSKRDNVFFGPNADAFGFTLDTYNDGIHAFFLGVTSCGVQTDTKVIDPNTFDDSWNVAWDSKTKITKEGWTAEMKIPYSALRFPKKEIQEWGVNFYRQIRRHREFCSWNEVKPTEQGMIHQSGILRGISNIQSPLRLSLTPYVSAYADNYNGNNTYFFNGGADIKYGINESFTLDATLIPDFGQVRSDDKVLNLSPYEIRYDERRSFFTEGTEIFNRGNLFYSRRVGAPILYDAVYDSVKTNEAVTKNPTSSQLYNATKISGRTKNNLGIGLFNATTAPTYATLTDTISGKTRQILTSPLTNYNVLVLDQSLKNNSYVSLTNTNVTRQGKFYNANVTGTEFKFANKKNKYAFTGTGAISQQFFRDSAKPFIGEFFYLAFGKISGNYTNNLVYRVKSDKYNPNDMAYLQRNNERAIFFNENYSIYKPFWKIVKMSNDLGIDYYMNYRANHYSLFHTDWNTDIDFKNYFTWGFFWYMEPFKNNFDYYQPRVEGRYYTYASNYGYGTYFSSDSRKAFQLNGSIYHNIYNERDRNEFGWSIIPRFRFNDKFNLRYIFNMSNQFNDVGYVDNLSDEIIFGVRNVNTKTNSLEGNYLFNNHMSLSIRVRHYWSEVKYSEFFELNNSGKDSPTAYNLNNDINFNAFNVDMAFTWQFAPASEMSVVWKNAILTEKSDLINKYFDNLNQTINSPQMNSFSIKVLYYLDYQMLKKKK